MKVGQLVTPWFFVENLECTPEELLKTIQIAADLVKPKSIPASTK